MASFTLTLELNATSSQQHSLAKKFRVNEFVYNACLNELHKRFKSYKYSKKRKNDISHYLPPAPPAPPPPKEPPPPPDEE